MAKGEESTAYFQYCVEKDPQVCSGRNSYASIAVGSDATCSLNAKDITSTTMTDDAGEDLFALKYTNTDSSTNNGVTDLIVGQHCDKDAIEVTTAVLVSLEQGKYQTEQSSKMGCPIFTANALIQWMEQYKFIVGPVFIGLGFFFALLGFKLFQVTLFMILTLVVTFLCMFLCYTTFLDDNTASWVGWTVLGVSIVLGLLGGWLMMKLEKPAAAILAGWGGFMIGMLLNESILFLASKVWLFWTVNVVCALIGAVLGFLLFEYSVCFGTAFIGSYLTMRGISLMAGGFPNIYLIVKSLENGDIDSFDWAFYGYFAGIIIMCIGCSIVQYKCWLKPHFEKNQSAYDALNGSSR